MKTAQITVRDPGALSTALSPLQAIAPHWVLVFGATSHLAEPALFSTLKAAFPDAALLGCSTAGEIGATGVDDGTCVVTAVHFDRIRVVTASTELADMEDSRAAGVRIGEQLQASRPSAVMVFGPGVAVNGSALVDGIGSVLGTEVPLTGGLAGDGGAFRQTWTLSSQGVGDRRVAAIGLVGDGLQFCHGSFGGWEPFGPARKVTRCAGNVLFELDGVPALEIYKRYLGEYANELPASGLLFPFAMFGENQDETGLIRTILGVSEAEGSLTLAGEILPDGYLKLMHASTDGLVCGAEAAAQAALAMRQAAGNGLAILVSCVGRKLVMGGRVEEEVEAVAEVFGQGTTLTGFYSYGEISPFAPGVACRLHNQTMTVTYLNEA